jgi:hypothetical protein
MMLVLIAVLGLAASSPNSFELVSIERTPELLRDFHFGAARLICSIGEKQSH